MLKRAGHTEAAVDLARLAGLYPAGVLCEIVDEKKMDMARAPELEHCSGEGATRADALGKLEEEIDAQLANMLSHGSTPPSRP